MAPVHSAAAEAPSADDDVLRSVASQRMQIWRAGFRPVAVYTVAAGLRLRHKQPGKRPFGNDWPTAARRNPPAAVTDPPQPDTTNTGILCDGLRCIDIDIDDLMVASGCAEIARKMFGAAPARYRNNSPRRLLLYRAAVGEPSKRVVVGTFGKVEILGRGQQFVAFGDHESGAKLQWEGDAPGTVSRDSIPTVEENQITGFLEAVSAIIGSESPSQKPGGKKSGKNAEPTSPNCFAVSSPARSSTIASIPLPDILRRASCRSKRQSLSFTPLLMQCRRRSAILVGRSGAMTPSAASATSTGGKQRNALAMACRAVSR
jgi:hypothetical protein